jgi:hypothetical protein
VIFLWEEVSEGLWFLLWEEGREVLWFFAITCCNARCAILNLASNNLQIQWAKEFFFNFSNFVVFS